MERSYHVDIIAVFKADRIIVTDGQQSPRLIDTYQIPCDLTEQRVNKLESLSRADDTYFILSYLKQSL
jgi:hypothetical protein